MSIRFLPVARRELTSAALFYENRDAKLGDRLLESVGSALRAIGEFPGAHPPIDSVYRRILLRKFPYSLIYRQEGETIWIIAVAHMRRRPGYWRRRKIGAE